MSWRTKEWTGPKMDKSDWGDGPWQTEPDELEWADGDTGLCCMIIRNGSGALCGYVGLPKGHEYFGVGYDEQGIPWFRAHGGLTYSGYLTADRERWWLGFDCAHSGDYAPADVAAILRTGLQPLRPPRPDDYKDIEYVRGQVKDLASQLITPIEALALVELGGAE